MNLFKIGDSVMIKSGGVTRTVIKILKNGFIKCSYLNPNRKFFKKMIATFNPLVLVKV